MDDIPRPAEAHVVRLARRARTLRANQRAWRRRSRRAQVAAVATILGLLIVVTFIANYLTTALPNTMGQNDLKHEVLVQNEVAQFAALLQATAESGARGAQISQAIVLGSDGAPPFAGQDGSVISPLTNGTGITVNFALVGPLRLPNGGIPNTGDFSSKCSGNDTAITCTGKSGVTWNFTAGNNSQYHVTGNGQLSVLANFTTNNSVIAVGSVGGASDIVSVFGSHNTIFVNATGGAVLTFLLVGSNNTVQLSGTGGASMVIFLVGNHDTVSTSTTGGGSVLMTAYGGYDSFTDSPSGAVVYWVGFNVENARGAVCPYQNIANTDTVSGSGGNVYYNNTNASNSNTSSSGWSYHYTNPPPSACPYVVTAVVGQSPAGTGFVVGLRNTYAPAAEVAYDEGAVLYAQPGSIPTFVVPPRISYSHGVLEVLLPQFSTRGNAEAGIGTADASVRLLAAHQFVFPAHGFTLGNNTQVTITIITPYAAAWFAYFRSVTTLSPFVSCSGPQNVCTGLYFPGGPLGTVKVSLPPSGLQLRLLVALFAFSLA